jgi:hypothetical protein
MNCSCCEAHKIVNGKLWTVNSKALHPWPMSRESEDYLPFTIYGSRFLVQYPLAQISLGAIRENRHDPLTLAETFSDSVGCRRCGA